MAEIQLTRIKSLYGDLKGLLGQIPFEKDKYLVEAFTVTKINETIDALSDVTQTDYSTYKIPDNQINSDWQEFPTGIVRTQLGRAISRLEEEYAFNREDNSQTPGIVIFNKNENEISLKINYTINDLAEKYPSDESKSKLTLLGDELKKPNKDWGKIKGILIWILNFSKDLFLEIIPIILQKKL